MYTRRRHFGLGNTTFGLLLFRLACAIVGENSGGRGVKIRGTVTGFKLHPPREDKSGFAVLTVEGVQLLIFEPALAELASEMLYRDVEAYVTASYSKDGDYKLRLYCRGLRPLPP